MAKRTMPPEPQKSNYRTTGRHIPSELWDLIGRLDSEWSRFKGGRASESALVVELLERHRDELEKKLAAVTR